MLVSVPVMLAAFAPAAPPVMLPVTTGAGQLYFVPAGTTPLVMSTGVTEKITPLQVTAVIGLMTAQEGSMVNVRQS